MEENKPDPVKKVIEELSHEAEQDKAAVGQAQSYLTTADPEQLEHREREYRDVEKHFVRNNWLRYAQGVAGENKRKIKYLALPAYYRLDVSLFQKHNILDSTETADGKTILAVAAFETDPTKYARMMSQSPAMQLLALSSVEEALTDKKNKYYFELLKLFPFDVVNLDLTTSLTPQHEGPYSTVMRALEEIMVRQAAHAGEWALFLTFRNVSDEWEAAALETFLNNLQRNLDQHPEVRDSFVTAYNCTSVKKLSDQNMKNAITQSVIKWLVDRAHHYGIRLVASRSYYYQRYEAPAPYTITKLMLRLTRGEFADSVIPTKDVPRQTWMNQDLLRCIERNQRRDVEEILYSGPREKLLRLESEIEELIRIADEQTGAAQGPPPSKV
jgi:hypothetical protein